MNNYFKIIAPMVVLFGTGCTTSLGLTADIRTESKTRAIAGVSYSLPMLQYELSIVRTLVQCERPKIKNGSIQYKIDANSQPITDANGNKVPETYDEIAFTISATAKETQIPAETYLIDHTSLAAETKTSSISIEFHEETGSLERAVDDKNLSND